MALGLVQDSRFRLHETPAGHPEHAVRLEAVEEVLREAFPAADPSDVVFLAGRPAPREALARVHEPAYLELLDRVCAEGFAWIGSEDTRISSLSADVARLATGGVLKACEEVMAGRVRRAFCAVRPPGHHAASALAGGFCLLNHVAVAAESLVRDHGLRRVAIVDFDAHHGHGTQEIFEERADVLYASLHQHPELGYPGTGHELERGRGAGEGTTVNAPLSWGAERDEVLRALDERIAPAVDRFRPEAILVSAGFDGARLEEISTLRLDPPDYGSITGRLTDLADSCAAGRLVSVLEGGYRPDSLTPCVRAHVEALAEGNGA